MFRYYLSTPRLTYRVQPAEMMGFEGGRRLPLDVHVNEDAYVIKAAIPGLKPEDVKVQILDDVVTLEGQVETPENGDSNYLMREIASGKFSRSLRLPEAIDAAKAEAEVVHGVLTIRLPKAEEARPKTIKVQAR